MQKRKKVGFSLIELSVVILVIGILVVGITQGSRIIAQSKLKSAQSLTTSSPVASMPNVILWLESTTDKSFIDSEKVDGGNGGNGTINTWYDINPQATIPNNAAQSSSFLLAAKPTYIARGINGLPVLRFTGNGAYLTYDSSALGGRDYTIFVVTQRNVGTNNNGFIGTYGGVSTSINLIYHNSTFRFQTGSDSFDTTIPAYKTPQPTIFTAMQNSVFGKKLFINGGTAYTSPSSTTLLANNINPAVGRYSGTSYNGDIGEVIIFNKILTELERKAIESYLSTKWGIRIS